MRLTFVVILLIAASSAVPASLDPSLTPRILRVDEYAGRAVELPPRVSGARQQLARIDGELYQKSRGFYLPVRPDRISVRLAVGVRDWKELVERAIAEDPTAFSPLAQLTARRVNRLGVVDLSVPEGTDLVAWCELVERTGHARYAEVATRGVYLVTQNDPRYPEQFALHNTGQSGGTPGADVDAERAWDLTAGDPSVVVAVLDSGTDIDHEDLAANIWHNAGEIPDNGIDDDANGFIDDWEGWDFNENDNNPRTTNYHGTFVMGIVNAAGSNGVGVAGLAGGAGSPGVRGMALAVGAAAPNADVIDDAILYAADNGARVITISLSVGETQAINDALDYAFNVRDVFVDCAAGNSGSEVGYPARRPEVMAVGSTDRNDQSSSFSNPGPEVEVSAPGSNVLSTGLADSYTTSSGTSFAAPYVGGLAGLIYSRNPGLSATDVRQIIIDTAEDVADPGFDERTGYGRINAYQAVAAAADSNGSIRVDRAGYSCSSAIVVTVSDIDLAGAGTVGVTLTSQTEPSGEPLVLVEAGAGSGVFRGSLTTAPGAPLADGELQLTDGDTLTAEYVDQDDGLGGSDVPKTATAGVDCESPSISALGVQQVSASTATITWETDEPAGSAVRYGDSIPPVEYRNLPGLTVTHQLDLDALDECTVYKFQVESTDTVGNLAVEDNAGAFHVFETLVNIAGVGEVPCHQGQVMLDRQTPYGCDESVGVVVLDLDLDADPGQAETVSVLMTSSHEPGGEWVSLTEINTQSSRFEGTVPLGVGEVVPADGVLTVGPGDLITATYHDVDDGQGRPWTATASSSADCSAPFIDELRVTAIAASRAIVEWVTDEPATSRLDFGDTEALGKTLEDPALVTQHRMILSPFDACDRVFFRVSSADVHGEVRSADAAGLPFAFNLNEIPGLVYHETFETDTGWTLPDDWERALPLGLGTNEGDPAMPWSGAFIIGNDLSGQGSHPGDYEPSTSSSALSPVFSTRQMRDLDLIVHRKLGVTSSDEAGIYVITSGTDQVWTSNYQVNDADWFVQKKDISALAGNKNSVQLEFRIESSDADTSFGWNIDEVIVKDRTLPDYRVCGGCGGAPAFGGATSVVDLDPCASGGIEIRWDPAAAWGTGVAGSYDVYRGASPDFVPSTANRVASGLDAITWNDPGAPLDTPVWYVVRARNDESCGGGEGLADENTVRLGVSDTATQPLPIPVGDTLLTGSVGDAHVRLEWQSSPAASSYSIVRGSSPELSDGVEIGTTTGTFFEDPGAVAAPESFYYRVLAVDACGRAE